MQDFGGSIAIHAFGAYFGLAASWVLFLRAPGAGSGHKKNASAYMNDVAAMIGTIFLWVYWPSFNAAVATVGNAAAGAATAAGASAGGFAAGGPALTTATLRMYAVVNTVLALCGACIATFAACSMFKGRLDMAMVQNSTLAGGVAMGSAVTMVVGGEVMNVTPGGAVGIGAVAGASVRACPDSVHKSDGRRGIRASCIRAAIHLLRPVTQRQFARYLARAPMVPG